MKERRYRLMMWCMRPVDVNQMMKESDRRAMMNAYPKIRTVTPKKNYQLIVTFINDITKVYDCTNLLSHPAFSSLSDPAIFQTVHLDHGGYGVIWNEDIDLSESELWIHGQTIANMTEWKQQ